MSQQQRRARLLKGLGWTSTTRAKLMVVVAHPDDETIALGGHLDALDGVTIVHATDGAPRNLRDAREKGFADAAAYSNARRRELQDAMALAGISDAALLTLGCSDQEAAYNLVALARRLADMIAERGADVVFTHAYEGGHPDHDATAFAAHAAAALLARRGAPSPLLIELPLYHSREGEPVRQRFAADAALPVLAVDLAEPERERKRRMFVCHASQRETLTLFHVEREYFRRAPLYDFRAPPNGGEIFYESFGWDFTGADFLGLAADALDKLELPACL